LANRTIRLARNIAEDVNAILSLRECFVDAVECGLELVLLQDYTRKKLELRRDWVIV
jgi:hypothetical protein